MTLMERIKRPAHFCISYLANWWYGRPSEKLIVIGVTGTKGKSTTCRYIASVLEAGGFKVGLLSTVEFQIGDKRWLNDKKMTMLGRGQVQRMLRDMVRAGCQYAVVETSSEGILQYRHVGIHYDVAVFTNLGTEHQERHGGFENLRRDKGKLFAAVARGMRKTIDGRIVNKVIITNRDDKEAGFFAQFPSDAKYTYSLSATAPLSDHDIVGVVTSANYSGVDFTVGDQTFHLNVVGKFNVYNALAALAVAASQNISLKNSTDGLSGVLSIPGRMDFVEAGQPFKVVVDYAHEPISYKALFETLKTVVAPGGKVIGIIGSDGGGRDVSKRPTMGAVAGELCDIVIVTDVNCFDEKPELIAEMLAAGARSAGKKDGVNLFVEVDRKKAIALAFSQAKSGDVVAITAKGTEPVICVAGGHKIPWSDKGVAEQLLKNSTFTQK